MTKAPGVGLHHISAEGIAWRDAEILSDATGKPVVCFSGHAQTVGEQQGLPGWAISLSHGRDPAVAFVDASE